MEKPVILSACRTPIGSFKGALSSLPATQLGAMVIREAVNRSNVPRDKINELYMGMVLQAGAGQAPARQALIYSGLANSIPATTVNKVCGSGMQTVIMGAAQIAIGKADFIIAGGMESMSQVPFAVKAARGGLKLEHDSLLDLVLHDGLWDVYNDFHMGMAAEKCAEKYSISRAEQDEFAISSYQKALAAEQKGFFKNEMISLKVPGKGGEEKRMDQDEEPGRANFQKIPGLRPAFKENGTVTAANASSLNDGASSLVLGSRKEAERLQLPILASIVDWSYHAGPPEWFTTAPVGAINKLLSQNKLTAQDIDLYEINEAFAVVVLAVGQLAKLPLDRINPLGGAVAMGHPIGCSGNRIIVTLIHNMIRNNASRGIAAICIGGGEALALLLER